MDLDARKKKLDALVERRNKCLQDIQRVSGRLDLAKKDRDQVEAECRAKNVDPNKLDEIIQRLLEKFDTELSLLDTQLTQVEKDIAPFLEKI
jgi:archaellum component FlaC